MWPFTLAVTRVDSLIKNEWPLLLVWLVAIVFKVYADVLFGDLASVTLLMLVLLPLVVAISLAAFAVVRHADVLAEELGEPLGTLILTLSVITIEVSIVAAVMLTGSDNPTMARDTMYSVIMIVMNGLVGFTLLFGGLKHNEQTYNLMGANTFLAIILPISIISLVLPNYTHAMDLPTYSISQSVIIGLSTLGLYAVFLSVQTTRHRSYFDNPDASGEPSEVGGAEHRPLDAGEKRHVIYHTLMLVAYLVAVVMMAKSIAIPVEFGIRQFGLPSILGGFVIAALILSPEAMGALESAMKNQLQRSINIYLGSVAATIGLTVPAVLCISVILGEPLLLGLETEHALLLVLTLAVSMITYNRGRTNILLGAVHLVLFATYIMLIFDDM